MLLFPLLVGSSQCCWSCCLSCEGEDRLVVWLRLRLFWGACCALLRRVESLKRLEFLKEAIYFFIFFLTLKILDEVIKKSCFPLALLEELLRKDKVRSYCCGAASHETQRSLGIEKQACSTERHSRFLKPFPQPPSMFRFILTSV